MPPCCLAQGPARVLVQSGRNIDLARQPMSTSDRWGWGLMGPEIPGTASEAKKRTRAAAQREQPLDGELEKGANMGADGMSKGQRRYISGIFRVSQHNPRHCDGWGGPLI